MAPPPPQNRLVTYALMGAAIVAIVLTIIFGSLRVAGKMEGFEDAEGEAPASLPVVTLYESNNYGGESLDILTVTRGVLRRPRVPFSTIGSAKVAPGYVLRINTVSADSKMVTRAYSGDTPIINRTLSNDDRDNLEVTASEFSIAGTWNDGRINISYNPEDGVGKGVWTYDRQPVTITRRGFNLYTFSFPDYMDAVAMAVSPTEIRFNTGRVWVKSE